MREIVSLDVADVRPELVLTVNLTRRLPDIGQLELMPEDIEHYGRLAILKSGILWFGDIHSSHPGTAQACFYWAVGGSTLYISPDGSTLGWQDLINAKTVRFIAAQLNLRRRFRYFTVVL
ncbi:MAG: hypothetical protein EA384_15115 [Spirochaetaceae bacterium]|nr:MAG: hypothetical protein EA384_15115 [Spirochaetaceae bacterium]